MKIYLDNSALNRPLDDQTQPRIWLEALAVAVILQAVEHGEVAMVKSPIHILENSRSPLPFRRQFVEKCLTLTNEQVVLEASVRTRAKELESEGISSIDALHIAAAEAARATHFISCDDRLLRRYKGKIGALNPVDVILQLDEESE